jgi:hypothetical protein
MSIARERCCSTESLAIPQVVELSVLIRVGPCVWPNSSRVVLSKIPALPFSNRAADSASAAEDMTTLRTLEGLRIAPLLISARGGALDK